MEQSVGQRVRRERLRQRLSQEVLARRAGISRSLLSRLEHGQHLPSEAELRALAVALDIPLWELLDLPLPKGSLNVGPLLAACSRDGRKALLDLLLQLTDHVREHV